MATKTRDIQQIDQKLLELGLKQHHEKFEVAVLGAVLLEKQAYALVKWLKPEYFTAGFHRKLWACLVKMESRNIPLDILNGSYCYLKIYGENEAANISSLTDRLGSAANIESHALHMVECWVREQACNTIHEMLKTCRADELTGVQLARDLQDMSMEIKNLANDTFEVVLNSVQYLKAKYEEEQISPFILLVEDVLEHIKLIKQKLNLL